MKARYQIPEIMKMHKPITVVLLVCLMTFILEVERKVLPHAVAFFHDDCEQELVNPTTTPNVVSTVTAQNKEIERSI